MTVRAAAKYRDSSSRTSSASRDSESVVNPTRSPNSTEVTRRSATGCVGGKAALAGADAAAARDSPHSLQKRPDAAAPHDGQNWPNRSPHEEQKRAPSGLGAAQL